MDAVYIGALFTPKITADAHYMSLADAALNQAQSEGKSVCHWYKVGENEKVLSASEGFSLIKRAISENAFHFHFHFQPVWQVIHGQKTLLFNEIMARMQLDGEEYNAGSLLEENPALVPRLPFWLPASGLAFAEKSVRLFASLIKHYGCRLSLHYFGRGNSEFAYLPTLPLGFLTVGRHFIQNAVADPDTRFFVRSLCNPPEN